MELRTLERMRALVSARSLCTTIFAERFAALVPACGRYNAGTYATLRHIGLAVERPGWRPTGACAGRSRQ